MTDTQAAAPRVCPHDDRKSTAAEAIGEGPILRLPDGSVRIGGFDLARQLLRGDGTRQAGFNAELLDSFMKQAHAPVLYQEGEAHQKQRSATARFFAPRVVTTRYRELMQAESERLIDNFRAAGRGSLDAMTMTLSVAVTAEIVGLTDSSRPGMAERLNAFFEPTADRDASRFARYASFLRGWYCMLKFYLFDVRPAIRARKQQRREDVISHLVDQTYSDRDILTESITYGAAGMATTREFIVMAAWHLFDRDDLRERFLAADEAGQIAVLEEILRLEPVVGVLYRRAERDLTLDNDGRPERIAAGTLIAIDVRAVNVDPSAAGACPHQLDADRRPARGKIAASLMTFGDGPHRCPGEAVALQEAAIFLDRLLRVPGIRLEQAPRTTWNPLVGGYELRGATVAAG
jgi:cytochrome P450